MNCCVYTCFVDEHCEGLHIFLIIRFLTVTSSHRCPTFLNGHVTATHNTIAFIIGIINDCTASDKQTEWQQSAGHLSC